MIFLPCWCMQVVKECHIINYSKYHVFARQRIVWTYSFDINYVSCWVKIPFQIYCTNKVNCFIQPKIPQKALACSWVLSLETSKLYLFCFTRTVHFCDGHCPLDKVDYVKHEEHNNETFSLVFCSKVCFKDFTWIFTLQISLDFDPEYVSWTGSARFILKCMQYA